MRTRFACLFIVLVLCGSALSCVSTGTVVSAVQSAVVVGQAAAHAQEEFTPEQEYYLGRAVGAEVLAVYSPYNNVDANLYLNQLGQTLALFSSKPQTFGGYHFLILDSEDINAFAAPGGLIFVTRGMIKCCESEEALAAVLAHEIGHVQLEHGLEAIESSRSNEVFQVLAEESLSTFGPGELGLLVDLFGDSIKDITSTMINNGYSREFEREADKAAVAILREAGYEPSGLTAMLEVMQTRLNPQGTDFAKTHPLPSERIQELGAIGVGMDTVQPLPGRQARYEQFLAMVQ
ncbi:MAG: peptidase M48 [Desulfovibrio sp.]|nr:MAG: peptidase M48 [Desulfovibrio sp.]